MDAHREQDSSVSCGEKQSGCVACNAVPKWARDLVMWRSVPKTTAVVVVGFVLLFLLMEWSLLSVVAYIGLATLASSIIARLVIKIKPQLTDSCPFISIVVGGCESNIYEITREQAERFVDVGLPHLNAVFAHIHETVSLNNPVDAVKHAILLWLLTFIGAWFNLLTLLAIGFGLVFSVPRVYEQFHKLLEFQKRRLEDLKLGYTEELSAVKEEFESELSFVKQKQERVMQELQDIVYAMEHDFLEDEELSKQEFQSLCDELKNKNLEEKHSLRVQLESQVEDLWAQFQQALKAYTEATEEKKKQYETLKTKDESSAQEIEMQMRKIQKVSERIAQVKARMLQNQRENEERNRLLRMQKDKTVQQFQGLKAQMQKEHEKNRALLEKMVVESKKSLKALSGWTERGEKLLKLAEICRKMETEMEKVLPFYSTSLTQEERADVEAALRENAAASLNERLSQLFFSYLDMEQFYQRYNKVLLDKLSLDKERQVLSTENAQLRALLKQYLDGISVNEEVISSLNPLFVVNYKTNVNLAAGPQGAGKKQPVVLEASSEARKLRLVS